MRVMFRKIINRMSLQPFVSFYPDKTLHIIPASTLACTHTLCTHSNTTHEYYTHTLCTHAHCQSYPSYQHVNVTVKQDSSFPRRWQEKETQKNTVWPLYSLLPQQQSSSSTTCSPASQEQKAIAPPVSAVQVPQRAL